MTKLSDIRRLAQIEYHGTPGVTQSCINALVRIINFGDRITNAILLSHNGSHCFLLTVNYGDKIAIKSGFASGYGGEGPGGLSTALQLLVRHGAEIEEIVVDEAVIERLDASCLLSDDLERIKSTHPRRPSRWYDYIFDIEGDIHPNNKKLQHEFPAAVPYSLIDFRLVDLALKLTESPDAAIMTGFRRLEDIVRSRTGLLNESGVRLFQKAFLNDDSLLLWNDVESGEHKGRANLFVAIYMAFRNPRAHGEISTNETIALREFLLINELFVLESQAVVRKIPEQKRAEEQKGGELRRHPLLKNGGYG